MSMCTAGLSHLCRPWPLCLPAVGAKSAKTLKAMERILCSVIAASCSTEGQIIEIKCQAA